MNTSIRLEKDLTDYESFEHRSKQRATESTHAQPMHRMTKVVKRILIIDDDRELSDLIRLALRENPGVRVTVADDPYEAMSIMVGQAFDMILLDWNLPKLNGLKTLLEAEKLFRFDPILPMEWQNKKARVVVFSGDEQEKCKFVNTHHFRFLGHIHKDNTLFNIMRKLNFYIQQVHGLAA
ncbi:MAG: response regulator [Bdellovibrionales bacterium]|nr:response regulator [Bdellovibrionales bacterium]